MAVRIALAIFATFLTAVAIVAGWAWWHNPAHQAAAIMTVIPGAGAIFSAVGVFAE